jgi:hypothetical protein
VDALKTCRHFIAGKGSIYGAREHGRYAAEFYTAVKAACTVA